MRKYGICFVVLFAIALAGCGGGGGSTSVLPFAGHWVGTWADTANAQSGTLDLVVGTDGSLSGGIHNSTLSMDGTASGTVSGSGHVTATYVYPASATSTATGTVAVGMSGHLAGVVQTYVGGVLTGSSGLDLTRQ